MEADIEQLKKENLQIKKRITLLEQNSQPASLPGPQKTMESDAGSKVLQESVDDTDSKSTLAVIMVILGAILCLTFIGIIIGLPLLIIGVVMLSKKKNKDSKIEPAKSDSSKHYNAAETKSIEEDIGMRWFGRIGILALVIGVGFFIKYAIDNGWISHLARIILGVLFGIALIVSGSLISKKEKYANFGKTLVGGGFAVTYFVIYSAYQFEEYRVALGISQLMDIILLSIVVVAATILSLKDNSQVIAAESFFLGYITTLLTNDFGVLTLAYGMLLTLGLVIVVCKKRWFAIGLGGVLASYFLYILWRADNQDSFASASFILIFYFIAFFIQSFFISKEELKGKASLMMVLNSFAFFLLYYNQIDKYYPDYSGIFTLAMSIISFAAYYIFSQKDASELKTTSLYLGIFFFTIAVPIQLNKEFVTVIWAAETVLLTVLWLKKNDTVFKISSFALGVFTAIKSLTYDMISLDGFDKMALLQSTRLFSLLATILAFYCIYLLLKANKDKVDNIVPNIYSWAASLVAVIMLFSEFNDYWLAITLSLCTIAFVLNISSKRDLDELRFQSYAFAAVIFFKVLFSDSSRLIGFSNFDVFGSTRLFSYLAAIATFYMMSHLETKDKGIADVLTYFGSFLLFISISLEIKEFWISIGWMIFALLLIVAGIRFQMRHIRIQGLIAFSLTIIKVFIYDIRNLELIYRTFSYIALGAILLLVSFLYTKYKAKFKEIL